LFRSCSRSSRSAWRTDQPCTHRVQVDILLAWDDEYNFNTVLHQLEKVLHSRYVCHGIRRRRQAARALCTILISCIPRKANMFELQILRQDPGRCGPGPSGAKTAKAIWASLGAFGSARSHSGGNTRSSKVPAVLLRIHESSERVYNIEIARPVSVGHLCQALKSSLASVMMSKLPWPLAYSGFRILCTAFSFRGVQQPCPILTGCEWSSADMLARACSPSRPKLEQRRHHAENAWNKLLRSCHQPYYCICTCSCTRGHRI